MSNLQDEVQHRYLDAIDDLDWTDEDPRNDFGIIALPLFIAAFQRETDPKRRSRLVRIVWQFRDSTALPALAEALRDAHEKVWKDALDGVVTLGGEQALRLLAEARATVAHYSDALVRIAWIDEAVEQIKQDPRAG
jgi:hypothetical protein